MKQLSLFLLSILVTVAVSAQYRRSVTVKAGQDAAQAFSPNGFYRLPQFSPAVLYTRMKVQNTQRLFNYNIFSGTVQFLSEQGDTMDLTNPTYFDSIVIDRHVFVYNDGFREQVAAIQPVRLFKKTVIKLEPQSAGAYGTTNSTAAVDKISTFAVGNNFYNFLVNQDVLVRETVDWFLTDASGKWLKANKGNLLALLPVDKKQATQDFIKQNKTDFNKEEQLKALFLFLNLK